MPDLASFILLSEVPVVCGLLWLNLLAAFGVCKVLPRGRLLQASAAGYRDASNRPFIHLVDGGLVDNLGVRGLLDRGAIAGSIVRSFDGVAPGTVHRLVLLVVNAERDRTDAGRGLLQGGEVRFEKIRAQQEVAGRITAEENFGCDDKFCALLHGRFVGGNEFLAIRFKRADRWVQLQDADFQRGKSSDVKLIRNEFGRGGNYDEGVARLV